MGERAHAEVLRLFAGVSMKDAAMALGANRKIINEWKWGSAPSAFYLARLHALGADVIWILTGHHGQHHGQ